MSQNDIEIFTQNKKSKISDQAPRSHKVVRGQLRGSDKTWIRKSMNSAEEAKRELLCQEFFRLIIPHQPETRIGYADDNQWYLYSEEVQGYQLLPRGKHKNFENGTYTGMGQALVTAMFVEEVDLKNGNICLDNQNRVIKIDGDHSFMSQPGHGWEKKLEKENFNMKLGSLHALPNPRFFYVYNWLDLVEEAKKCAFSAIIPNTLHQSPQFCREVNQATLRIILLPDNYITDFVTTYLGHDSTIKASYIQRIIKRRNQLAIDALQHTSFLYYINFGEARWDAQSDMQTFKQHMLQFKSHGHQYVISEQSSLYLSQSVSDRFKLLNPTPDPLLTENTMLLSQLKENRLPGEDSLLDAYLLEKENEIKFTNYNHQKLIELNHDLKNMKQKTSLNEVNDVIGIVRHLAKNRNTKEKSQKIWSALQKLPLHERGNVISSLKANSVQEELARHRSFWKMGKVYKKDEQIDIDTAANSFKTLKKKYSNIKADIESENNSEPQTRPQGGVF